jgi:hypothetical protein
VPPRPANPSQDTGRFRRTSRRAELFQPPHDLISRVSLEEARGLAQEFGKWILVTVQDPAIFNCHCLTRDVWRDDQVQMLLKKNFIFLYYYKDDEKGRTYINDYFQDKANPDAYPHVSLFHPQEQQPVSVLSGPPLPTATNFYETLWKLVQKLPLIKSYKPLGWYEKPFDSLSAFLYEPQSSNYSATHTAAPKTFGDDASYFPKPGMVHGAGIRYDKEIKNEGVRRLRVAPAQSRTPVGSDALPNLRSGESVPDAERNALREAVPSPVLSTGEIAKKGYAKEKGGVGHDAGADINILLEDLGQAAEETVRPPEGHHPEKQQASELITDVTPVNEIQERSQTPQPIEHAHVTRWWDIETRSRVVISTLVRLGIIEPPLQPGKERLRWTCVSVLIPFFTGKAANEMLSRVVENVFMTITRN